MVRAWNCDACRTANEEREERERAAQDQAKLEQQRADREARLLQLLEGIGGNPWEHGHATLANFDASESGPVPGQAVREFLDAVKGAARYTPVRGLYLCGDTGPGKTHLAVAAVRELLLDPSIDPDDVVFDHAIGLITEIQDTYNTGASTQGIIQRRIRARVWILDDLGAERASDDVVTRLTLIFTKRAMRPTLVTSNDPPSQLEKRHRALSRIQSRLGPRYFRTVEVKGRDRRFDAPPSRQQARR